MIDIGGMGWGDGLTSFVKEVVSVTTDFANGVANAVASNATTVTSAYGNSVSLVDRVSPTSDAMAVGQTVGDVISVVQGGVEFVVGTTVATGGTVTGVVTAPTGVGLVAGATVTTAGVVTAGHGLNTAKNGIDNLLNSDGASDGGTFSRKEAIQDAKNHSQVPRNSKGGEDIGMGELNESSRGGNYGKMKSKGATKLGRRNPNGKNKWMEHPDGHPDAGQKGVPEHHNGGHVHSTNTKGETKVIPYKD